MTEDIVKSIAEAEAQAAEIKAKALEQAAKISSAAESRAQEIEKSSLEVCKAYRETQLKAAQSDAEKAYAASVAQSRENAKAYADKILQNAGVAVSGIVGRVTSGNR